MYHNKISYGLADFSPRLKCET